MAKISSSRRPYFALLGVAGVVFGLDQLIKAWVRNCLEPNKIIQIIPGFFDLVNVSNRGAAFGFLNRSDIEWQFWLFLGATGIAFWAIFALARNGLRKPLLIIGLGMILGGAAGNLVDRIRYRAVIDFLDFYWQNWHWPAFNIADIGICLGVLLACIATWSGKGARS